MMNRRFFFLFCSVSLHTGLLLALISGSNVNHDVMATAIEVSIENIATPPAPQEQPPVNVKADGVLPQKIARNISVVSQNAPAPAQLSNVAAIGTGDSKPNYLSVLAAWLDKFKIYPQLAREEGIEGRGILSLTIDEHGHVMRRSIKESTGNRALDLAIIQMATNSSPVPKPDQYASLSFDIPIEFRLR
jgi:TonB family protein